MNDLNLLVINTVKLLVYYKESQRHHASATPPPRVYMYPERQRGGISAVNHIVFYHDIPKVYQLCMLIRFLRNL